MNFNAITESARNITPNISESLLPPCCSFGGKAPLFLSAVVMGLYKNNVNDILSNLHKLTLSISLVLSVIALFMRVGIVKRLISSFPAWEYIYKVFGMSMVISVLSMILPVILHKLLPSSLVSTIVVTLASISSTLVFIYALGMTRGEKDAMLGIIKNKIHK